MKFRLKVVDVFLLTDLGTLLLCEDVPSWVRNSLPFKVRVEDETGDLVKEISLDSIDLSTFAYRRDSIELNKHIIRRFSGRETTLVSKEFHSEISERASDDELYLVYDDVEL